jgi:2,3-bisphosphoglycerate-dependent phosphoglycerate mutase
LGKLILSRHGESVFNARSLWTGIWDVPLTKKGRHEATLMGEALAGLSPDEAYSSALLRARDTLKIILRTNNWHIPLHISRQLNERDYGELTGLNKWEVEKKYGDSQFSRWRRGWDAPVPDGETLKDVYNRAIPYFQTHILPSLMTGKTVLVTAHGNTLRALIKYLDDLSDDAVEKLEMPFGELLIYDFNEQGKVTKREKIIHIKTTLPPA